MPQFWPLPSSSYLFTYLLDHTQHLRDHVKHSMRAIRVKYLLEDRQCCWRPRDEAFYLFSVADTHTTQLLIYLLAYSQHLRDRVKRSMRAIRLECQQQ